MENRGILYQLLHRFVDFNGYEFQGGSWILTHIISLCYVSLIYLVKGQSLCPIDYYGKPHNAPLYGGYSDEYTCVSFVPRHEVPKCSSVIHKCLDRFCMSQFLDGHLMNWDKEDLSRIKRYNLLMHTESVSVLNGRILLDRVYFTDTRPGQRGAATVFSCMSFRTYCATGCSPLEYCVWYVDAFNRFFGLWDDWYVGSSFLEDLKSQNWKEKLVNVGLPACRNVRFNRSSDETVVIDDLYACNDLKFDYFACQHKKYPPCKVRKEKKCHYSPKYKECRLWKYIYEVLPSKYGLPCDEESTETCPCPCSGVPNEWSSWSATCGTTTRYRWRPKNPEALDCAKFPDQCCREDDVKHEEDCKNYAFNSSVNLRLEDCYRGRKGADVHGHLQCVCDPGFTDLLCATGTKECKKIATCENGGTCIENAGAFSCKCPETFGGHRCEYKVSWCNDTTCNGRGICVNITSLLTWRCYCDSGFTGSQCQMVKKSTSSVRRSTEETVRSSIRIWIILIMVLTGTVLLLGIGASYTAKERLGRCPLAVLWKTVPQRGFSEVLVRFHRLMGEGRVHGRRKHRFAAVVQVHRKDTVAGERKENRLRGLGGQEDGVFSWIYAGSLGFHLASEVSWCNETTCNGRGICVNITSLLTWRCFCDRGFTGRQCQTVEGKIGIVTRSTKEAVGSSARIWIILVMVFTGMVLFGVGALYTTKKRRRHRRQHRSASSSVRQGLSRGRRGKWKAPVNQSSSSCVSTAKPTRGFSLLTRDMCSSLKNPEPVRNKPNRWRTQPST